MKLIFELGTEGRGLSLMPACDVPEYTLPEERTAPLRLPHVSENELTRHYTALCKRIHGVNDGFYPLGSCTMKYNPKIDEDMAALPGFTAAPPLQPVETAQGALGGAACSGQRAGRDLRHGRGHVPACRGRTRRIHRRAAHQGIPHRPRRRCAHEDHRARLRPRNEPRHRRHVRLSGGEHPLRRGWLRRSRRAACRRRPRHGGTDAHEPEHGRHLR